jgi:hypothetical protein
MDPAIFGIPVCDVVCRNPLEGIAALIHLGPFDELYLDHDMGNDLPIEVSTYDICQEGGKITQYSFGRINPSTPRVPFGQYESNGYGVLCFLEENVIFMPKSIILVTDNSSAMVKMMAMLKKWYPFQNGCKFSKVEEPS